MARSTIQPAPRRVPTQIQTGAVGTINPAVTTGRNVPLPSFASPGPSQRRERFAGVEGITPAVARALSSLQDEIAYAIGVVRRLPFADGNLIQGVTLVAGLNTPVVHGLGRPWRGFMVVNVAKVAGGGGVFYTVPQTPKSLEAAQILINNDDSTVVGDVWVW